MVFVPKLPGEVKTPHSSNINVCFDNTWINLLGAKESNSITEVRKMHRTKFQIKNGGE